MHRLSASTGTSEVLALRNYVQGPILERREHSTISLGTHQPSKRHVTFKIVFKSSMSRELIEERAMRELASHPGVLPLIDFLRGAQFCIFVVKYCNGGDILSLLSRETSISEEFIARIFSQIAKAVSYAHNHGWVHRDIKPENILWHNGEQGVEVYLADWGSASKCVSAEETFLDNVAGTEGYAAPEVFLPTLPYSPFASDVWSLGATLYVLWMERFPFEDDYPRHNYGPFTMPKTTSPELEDLLKGCLFLEPITRFTMNDVLRCNWLRMYGHWQAPSILHAIADVAIEVFNVIS